MEQKQQENQKWRWRLGTLVDFKSRGCGGFQVVYKTSCQSRATNTMRLQRKKLSGLDLTFGNHNGFLHYCYTATKLLLKTTHSAQLFEFWLFDRIQLNVQNKSLRSEKMVCCFAFSVHTWSPVMIFRRKISWLVQIFCSLFYPIGGIEPHHSQNIREFKEKPVSCLYLTLTIHSQRAHLSPHSVTRLLHNVTLQSAFPTWRPPLLGFKSSL